MQGVLDALHEHHLEKEAATLERFYDSVKLRAEGIESAEGKQRIIVELYDKFFQSAFPKMSERLGIVYTPIEIVDFILKSVDHLLRAEFGESFSSEGVHILDPFTGTGTFITRLLQSGLIDREALPRKYAREIHANELVLLAYYIAAINIEAAYHDLIGGPGGDLGGDGYRPFEGICLTDTFQMYEREGALLPKVLADNSKRRQRQKKLDIRVIVGNPPYSVGQQSANDNNQNVKYPTLDGRIGETYAARSVATNKNALYDSYIRAIRWASDRVGESGVVGFVTNANFIEASTADGLRHCLVEEFSSLYVFHLRGNQRTSGERSRREGGKIFGGGSRAPIAISLLVKNPKAKESGRIFFRDVGDYLSREEKLEIVAGFGSVGGITEADGWTEITPDEHGDWLRQRDATFTKFMGLNAGRGADHSIFKLRSRGLETGRDAWVYATSRQALVWQVSAMSEFYNSELNRFDEQFEDVLPSERASLAASFVDRDAGKIKWTSSLELLFARGQRLICDERAIRPSLYRPYSPAYVCCDPTLIHRMGQMPRIFPNDSNLDDMYANVRGGKLRYRCFSWSLSGRILGFDGEYRPEPPRRRYGGIAVLPPLPLRRDESSRRHFKRSIRSFQRGGGSIAAAIQAA